MAIARKSEQVLSYLKVSEREELDAAADELEVSRADYIRQCVLESLERRRQGLELVAAAGEFTVVDHAGTVIRGGDDVVSLG